METIVTAQRTRDRVFAITTWAGHHLATESRAPDAAAAAGPAPMEMLLAGLASCAGGTFAQILDKMRVPYGEIAVRVDARRSDDLLKVWSRIHYEIEVEGDISPERAARALELTDRACPASVMLSRAAELSSSVRVVDQAPR